MWYVVQVGAGNEAHMKEILDDFLPKGLVSQVFYPMYESSYKKNGIRQLVTKVLFPGYLFIDMEHSGESGKLGELEECLKGITEFHHLLTVGKVCTPVSAGEQIFLARHTNTRHVMTMSRGYMINRTVTITEGAFEGFCGELKYVDRHNQYGIMTVKLGAQEIDMRFGLEIVKRQSA